MRVEQFFFGNPFESEFDLPPGFMGGVAVQEQEEQEEGVTPPLASNPLYTGGQLGSITDAYKDVLASGATTDDPDEVSAYYDLGLRESEKTSGLDPFADTFGSEAAGMGGVSAAAGAGMNIPATALSNVVSAEDYAAATTDYTPELSQDQGDFTGKLNRFTATAQEDLGGFQNEIRTLLLDKVPQIQATTGANYEQALYTAYTQDPEVQQLLGQYGVNPLFADGTGQYLYDPFSFGELRTYEINESDFATGVRTLAEIGKAVMAAQVMGGLTSAALSATGLPTGAEAGTGTGTAASTAADGATGGFAGPLNMLTSALAVKSAVDTAQDAEKTTDDYTDPVLAAIAAAESLQEGGLFTTVNPLAGAQIPTVTTEEVTGGGTSAEAQAPTFTQEQVDAQIAEAVSGATEGLLTQEQADAATQEAIDNLPADTTEYSQEDLDKAVSDALADAKLDSDAALAGAYQVFQDNLPEDTTLFNQDDVDKAVTDALSAIPKDVTPFNQDDIDTAVQTALDALPEDTTQFSQEDVDTAVKEALAELQSDFSFEKTGFESTIEGLQSTVEQTEQELAGSEQEVIDLTNLVSNLESTASDLRTTLESTQTALQEQQEITQAKESDIEGLTTSVNTLTGTVSDLSTKITEVTAAKDKAIADGDQKLADAMANAEATLEATKAEAEETLQNAIAAGETKAADAVAAGQAAVADAVAAGEAAVASAVAQGQAEVAEAVAAGEAAATAAEAAGREEGFGEGLGQGRGEGVGAGTGLGLALGLGAGMLQPQSVTKTMFEDFEFEKKYEAPEILAGLTGLPVYQAPKIGLFQGLI